MQTRKPRSKGPARLALAGMTMLASGGFMYAVLTGTTGDENATETSLQAFPSAADDSAAGAADASATASASNPTSTPSADDDAEATPTARPRATAQPSVVTPRRPRTRSRSS